MTVHFHRGGLVLAALLAVSCFAATSLPDVAGQWTLQGGSSEEWVCPTDVCLAGGSFDGQVAAATYYMRTGATFSTYSVESTPALALADPDPSGPYGATPEPPVPALVLAGIVLIGATARRRR